MEETDFPFPTTEEHTTILGRNGSGKSQGGLWLLSYAPFDRMPYVLIDHKGDDLIRQINATPLSLHGEPPSMPGIYHIKARPHVDDEALETLLFKIHARGRTGLFFDEGGAVSKFQSVDIILMQGRSLQIPVTIISQRPVMISRYAFSEASHLIAYHLHDRRDKKTTREFFNNYDERDLPQYHAQWYEVKKNKNHILQPVPDSASIVSRFNTRLEEMKPKSRFI